MDLLIIISWFRCSRISLLSAHDGWVSELAYCAFFLSLPLSPFSVSLSSTSFFRAIERTYRVLYPRELDIPVPSEINRIFVDDAAPRARCALALRGGGGVHLCSLTAATRRVSSTRINLESRWQRKRKSRRRVNSVTEHRGSSGYSNDSRVARLLCRKKKMILVILIS